MGEICFLFNVYKLSKLTKAFLADAVDDKKMFWFAKRAVTLSVFENLPGKYGTDVRKFLQIGRVGFIDVDSKRCVLR